MIDRLLDFLTGRAEPTLENAGDELELSVTALLIEAARMDNDFSAAERTTIERLLAKKFALSPEALQSLCERADRVVQHSTQYFPFTHQISTRMSAESRIHMIEMLWKVAYSDGSLDPHEDALLRQIAGLIHVPDRERGAARKRALKKLAEAKGRADPEPSDDPAAG
jgi:uncharacterized tellurite resistance protein B-like protein